MTTDFGRPFAALCLLLVAGLSGCASSEQRAAGVPPQVRAGVQAFADQGSDLSDAVELLTQRCMRSLGKPYYPNLGVSAGGNLGGAMGLMTDERARTRGYAPRTITNEADRQSAYLQSLTGKASDQYADALSHGPEVQVPLDDGMRVSTRTQGCFSGARVHVYGSAQNFLQVDNFLQSLKGVAGDWEKDPQVAEAMNRYGQCMRSKGVRSSSIKEVDAVVKKLPKRTVGSRPGAAERELAGHDAACQTQAGLRKSIDDAVVAASADWLKSHEKQVIGLAEVLNASKARAAAVLAGGKQA